MDDLDLDGLICAIVDLVEGRDPRLWKPWWRQHGEAAKALLPRMQYLRLRFEHVNGAAEVLRARGVSFEWSTHAAEVARLARYDESVTDEDGRLLPSFRARAYGGALAALDRGDPKAARAQLRTFVQREVELETLAGGRALGELVMDLEAEAETHGPVALRILAGVLAELPPGEWIDPALDHLEEALSGCEPWVRRLEGLGLYVSRVTFFSPSGWVVGTPARVDDALWMLDDCVYVHPSVEGWTLRLTVHGGPHWLSQATDANLESRVLDAMRADRRNPGPEWRLAAHDE